MKTPAAMRSCESRSPGPRLSWAPAFAGALLASAACATAQTPPTPSLVVTSETPPNPPAGMQWLYGSGEGGASGLQAYRAFLAYVLARAAARPSDGVVLAEGATLDDPAMVPCGDRPLAVVLDVDETALQNLGFEYDDALHQGRPYDQQRWNRWERTGIHAVSPIPGAVAALQSIRNHDVAVIFNSNRLAANAAETEAAINDAGLGPAVHGETLYLQGDVAPGSAKDPRRASIAAHYCVIAMAGDQLGDFSDLFNARTLSVPDRRRYAISPPFSALWGQGWFILANPVYGSGLRGTIDDVFPADRRWTDPQGGNR
jgi:5'-nucleotidase (lipoprotein e(P4) family)